MSIIFSFFFKGQLKKEYRRESVSLHCLSYMRQKAKPTKKNVKIQKQRKFHSSQDIYFNHFCLNNFSFFIIIFGILESWHDLLPEHVPQPPAHAHLNTIHYQLLKKTRQIDSRVIDKTFCPITPIWHTPHLKVKLAVSV